MDNFPRLAELRKQENTNWKYLFLISTLIYVVIVVFSLVTGTPSKFAVPIDPDGHICGQGESKDYPYIYFAVPFENYLHRTLCLSECPRVHGIQSTPSLVSKVGSSTKLACLTNSLVTTCEQTISSNDSTNHDSDVFIYDSREALGRVCVPTREDFFNAVQPALPTNYQIPSIIYEIHNEFVVILLYAAITGVLCILNGTSKRYLSEGFQQIIFPLLSVICFFAAGFSILKKICARLFGSQEKIHLHNDAATQKFSEMLLTMTINPIVESILCLLCFYASLMSIISLIKLIKTKLQVSFFENVSIIVSNIKFTSLQFALLVLSLITLSFNFFVFEHVLAIGSSLEAEEMKTSLPFERFKPTNLAIFLFLITLFISLWNIAFFVKAIEFLSMLCSRNHIHNSKRQNLNDFTNLNLTWNEVGQNLLELIQSDLGTIAKDSMISLLFSFIRKNILEPIHQIVCEQTEQKNTIYTKINSYYEGSFIQLHEPYLKTFNIISGTAIQLDQEQKSNRVPNEITENDISFKDNQIQKFLEYFETVESEAQDFIYLLPSIAFYYLQTDSSTSTRIYPTVTVLLSSLIVASHCSTLFNSAFSYILIYCSTTSKQQEQTIENTQEAWLTRKHLRLVQSTFDYFKNTLLDTTRSDEQSVQVVPRNKVFKAHNLEQNDSQSRIVSPRITNLPEIQKLAAVAENPTPRKNQRSYQQKQEEQSSISPLSSFRGLLEQPVQNAEPNINNNNNIKTNKIIDEKTTQSERNHFEKQSTQQNERSASLTPLPSQRGPFDQDISNARRNQIDQKSIDNKIIDAIPTQSERSHYDKQSSNQREKSIPINMNRNPFEQPAPSGSQQIIEKKIMNTTIIDKKIIEKINVLPEVKQQSIKEHIVISQTNKAISDKISDTTIKVSCNFLKNRMNTVKHKLKQIENNDYLHDMIEVEKEMNKELQKIEEKHKFLNSDQEGKVKMENIIYQAELQIINKFQENPEQLIEEVKEQNGILDRFEKIVINHPDPTSDEFSIPFAMLAINDYYEKNNIPLIIVEPNTGKEIQANKLAISNKESTTELPSEEEQCKQILQMQMVQTGQVDIGYHVFSGEYYEDSREEERYVPEVGKSNQENNKITRELERKQFQELQVKKVSSRLKESISQNYEISKDEIQVIDLILEGNKVEAQLKIDNVGENFNKLQTKKFVDGYNYFRNVTMKYTTPIHNFKLTEELFNSEFNGYWFREQLKYDYGYRGSINGNRQPYYYPYDWIGYGLNVDHLIEIDKSPWLDSGTEDGTWIVLYYNQKEISLEMILPKKEKNLWDSDQTPISSIDGTQPISSDEICRFTGTSFNLKDYKNHILTEKVPDPDPDSMQIIMVGRKQYYFVFQCRVNPQHVYSPVSNKNIYVVKKEMASASIRPYRILVQEVQY